MGVEDGCPEGFPDGGPVGALEGALEAISCMWNGLPSGLGWVIIYSADMI